MDAYPVISSARNKSLLWRGMTTELSRKCLKSLAGINKDITLKLQDKLVEFVLDLADLNRELTPVEQIRLDAFAMAVFRQWDHVIYQGELGTIDKPRVEGCVFAMPTFLSGPRLRASWAEHRGAFSPELNQRVDKWLEANVETKLSIG